MTEQCSCQTQQITDPLVQQSGAVGKQFVDVLPQCRLQRFWTAGGHLQQPCADERETVFCGLAQIGKNIGETAQFPKQNRAH